MAGAHESVVQTLPSSQFGGVPAWQAPVTQVSSPLHALLSVQSAFVTHPPTGGVNVTLNSGRRVLLAVVDSFDSNRSPSVPVGRIAHPKLLEGADDQA